MPEAKKAERYKSLVGLYSALKNYPKAIDYGNRALKVARSRHCRLPLPRPTTSPATTRKPLRVMNELLASIEQSGHVPKEQQLLLVRAACAKAGDNACVAGCSKSWSCTTRSPSTGKTSWSLQQDATRTTCRS